MGIGSMADGNRRNNHLNANDDADFFRFPIQKTLYETPSNNIGLYSPLVSSRGPQISDTSQPSIFNGVPSYLNPNLMRHRANRSKSVKSNHTNDDAENPQIQRSQSTKLRHKNVENIIDFKQEQSQ